MAEPLRRDLVARRNAPFAWEWAGIVDDNGAPVDFTAATDLRMHVRLYGAAAGDPLIGLAEVSAALTEGLIPGVGWIQGFIDEASLATTPTKAPGETVRFEFDLIAEFSGAVPEVWVEGFLTVDYGVTDRLGIRITDTGAVRITGDGSIRITG